MTIQVIGRAIYWRGEAVAFLKADLRATLEAEFTEELESIIGEPDAPDYDDELQNALNEVTALRMMLTAIEEQMGWTDDRIAALRMYWSAGLTAQEIADRMGQVTRNAVIGKVNRLGLDARPSPIIRPAVTRDRRDACQWIFGDADGMNTSYCGAPVKPKSSYCEFHHARCFEKKAVKSRA